MKWRLTHRWHPVGTNPEADEALAELRAEIDGLRRVLDEDLPSYQVERDANATVEEKIAVHDEEVAEEEAQGAEDDEKTLHAVDAKVSQLRRKNFCWISATSDSRGGSLNSDKDSSLKHPGDAAVRPGVFPDVCQILGTTEEKLRGRDARKSHAALRDPDPTAQGANEGGALTTDKSGRLEVPASSAGQAVCIDSSIPTAASLTLSTLSRCRCGSDKRQATRARSRIRHRQR